MNSELIYELAPLIIGCLPAVLSLLGGIYSDNKALKLLSPTVGILASALGLG
jgi:hypothetical protein